MRRTKYILLSVVILVFALGLSACQQPVPKCTVLFDSLCGISVPQQVVKKGDKIVKPDTLYRENFEFEGWYVSKDFGEDTRWSFAGHTVTGNMTLYANWTRLPTVGLRYYKLADTEAYGVSAGEAGYEEDIFIPSKHNGLPVTEIGDFSRCENLKSITIPDSVTEIGDYAFEQCINLTNIELPNSVTIIGTKAFLACSSLTTIVIPGSVARIGKNAFNYCYNLTSITISNHMTTIETYAFSDCNNLSIYIEAGYKTNAEWEEYWNVFSRPVIYGCVLSSDQTYVVYLSWRCSVINPRGLTINAPYRKGYTFGGWTSLPNGTVAECSAEDLESAPDDITPSEFVKLYAIWIKN